MPRPSGRDFGSAPGRLGQSKHGVSPHTHDLLSAARLKWHGDARDNDVPRVVNLKHGEMAHIPWSDFTDNRVLRSSSMDLWDVYREAFDYLYLANPAATCQYRCIATMAAGR